jgi:hypothetical protein
MICNMEIIVDLFWFVVSAGLIYLYVRNTNRVVKELINELEHKKKLYEQKTNNPKN